MSARPSSLLLLLTFAASLPARLGAAWSAFANYDARADQAQPEPGTSCHGCGTTEKAPAEEGAPPAEEIQSAAEESAPPAEESPPQAREDLATFESQALAAHLEENAAWIDEIDTPQWRRSPWQIKLQSVMHAAARGAVVTSICCGRHVPRDSVRIMTALNLLTHELNHPLTAYNNVGNADASEVIN